MFTIEKHLELLSTKDENCKVIYSIWNLNKKSLKKALSTIQITFPHYSIHDYSHADTIIQNIELFLGESRIEKLSVTDSWLILMAAYTHDIGMIVFMKDLEYQIQRSDFIEKLELTAVNNYDYDLAEAAQLVLRLINKLPYSNIDDNNTFNYALKLKKAVTILSADLFRKIHHEQSRDILKGINDAFKNEFNKFYSHDIPIRFLQTLGDIAYSHGIDFENSLKLLPQKSNGYCSDYMHPRFIACMLRLGDLLDVDDKRFNQFSKNIFDIKGGHIADEHEIKHASITHLLVTPDTIEVTVNCKDNENVFRIANQWFDWLKKEIENQNKEWHRIRPDSLPGLAPTLSKDKIKVLLDDKEIDNDLINLQFNISKEKVFEIFEGKALYDDPSFVFLREISQNSVDATKLQMWNDIRKGVYDSIIKSHLVNLYNEDFDSLTHTQLISCIRFPLDIPKSIYDNYPILLSIDWKDDKKEILEFQIIDKGYGIDKSTLLRMSNSVGESRVNDLEYQQLKKELPFFLKPTGAFGLGLQSIFLVTNEFKMITKSEKDSGFNIIFRSAKRNEYISVRKLDNYQNNGSSITIEIPRIKFEDVFTNSFSSDELIDFDIFTDSMGSPYLHKISHYVRKNLLSQFFLNFKITGNSIEKKSILKKQINDIEKENILIGKPQLSKSKEILTLIKLQETHDEIFGLSNTLSFECFEYLEKKVGSQIIFEFIDNFGTINYNGEHYNSPSFNFLYSVRDIHVEDKTRNLYATNFSALKINYLNPESDKILNIARNKLIEKTKELNNQIFVNYLLPELLLEIKSIFEANYELLTNQISSTTLGVIYFHISLTFHLNDISKNNLFKEEFFGNIQLPVSVISNVDKEINLIKTLTPMEFYSQKSLILSWVSEETVRKILNVDVNQHYLEYSQYLQAFKILNSNNEEVETCPVVWFVKYLRVYLYKRYSLHTFLINREKLIIYGFKVIETSAEIFTIIEVDELDLPAFYNHFFYKKTYRSFGSRRIFYPFNLFAKNLAVKNLSSDGFDHLPEYINHGIISPFVDYNQFLKIRKEILEIDKSYEEIRSLIKSDFIDSLINDKIVNHIIDNASLSSDSLKDQHSIKNSYIDLVTEIIYYSKAIELKIA